MQLGPTLAPRSVVLPGASVVVTMVLIVRGPGGPNCVCVCARARACVRVCVSGLSTEQMLLKDMKAVSGGELHLAVSVIYLTLEARHTHAHTHTRTHTHTHTHTLYILCVYIYTCNILFTSYLYIYNIHPILQIQYIQYIRLNL